HAVLVGRPREDGGEAGALGEDPLVPDRVGPELGPVGRADVRHSTAHGRDPRIVIPGGRGRSRGGVAALRVGDGQVLHHAAVTGRVHHRDTRGGRRQRPGGV